MLKIFSPFITVLNHMDYTRKFILLWLTSLITITVLAYNLFANINQVVQPAQRQLQGLPLIEPVSRTLQILQLHRGLSVALLSGDETMRDRRTITENQVTGALRETKKGLPADLAMSEDYGQIMADWEQLKKTGLQQTAIENFAAHTRLIERIHAFEVYFTDQFGLLLGTEIATHYLIDATVNRLQLTLEHLGQIRAYGTGILAKKRITEADKARLHNLTGKFDSTFSQLKTSLDKTALYNPVVEKTIQGAYLTITDATRAILEKLESDILTGDLGTAPETFLNLATSEIDKSYAQMYKSLLPAAETLIKARISRAKETLYRAIIVASLMFLLIVYISTSIYLAIVSNIKILVRAANDFAKGNLNQRIDLDTSDELGQIGDSFNRMANGFRVMLETRNLAVEALHKAKEELTELNINLETRVRERTHELKLAMDRADAANQAKSSFLSNMSHEIRSPLAAVIGFSESLKTDNLDEQERKKIISTIVRNGRHLLQIINDILDLSKIESGQLEVENISTSVFFTMGEIDSLLGMNARDKGLEFKITYHFPLPAKIDTDPVRLKQILVNLCSNAIKFTDKGRIEISVSCDKDCREIRFVVSDSGVGMTPEELERIFDPFSQADATTTRKFGGTGLGLSISCKLAEALAGRLTCESSKGQGSRFTLVVTNHDKDQPVLISSLEEVSIHHDSPHDQLDIRHLSGQILLAEDSPDNQQLISMYIRKTGAQLTTVENGKEAVEQAQRHRFDLILMDMQMPVMDGIEATTRIRASGYTGPIVSLTANAMLSDRQKCEAAGADDYLVKPIDLHRFYRCLNSYLEEDTGGTGTGKIQNLEEALRNSPQYKAVIQRFLDSLPQIIDDINAALNEENWNGLQAKTHDLKGMGGAVGFPGITEKAGIINALLKQSDHARLADACADLETQCHNILQEKDASG